MTYSLCAVISIFILYYIEHSQCKNFNINKFGKIYSNASGRLMLLFVFIILLVYWTLVIGLQYETGTDYGSYRKIFSSKNRANFYRNNFELLFSYIAFFLIDNKINPQFGFIIIAFIQFYCFFWFLNKIRIKYYYLFLFVYFFVSVAFYNQTNGIRQYTAIYIFVASIYFMYSRKFFYYLICIIIAGLFHTSAFFLIPFYFLYQLSLRLKYYTALLVTSVLISMFGIDRILDIFVPYLEMYAHYLTSEFGKADIALINKLTKYIFVPFYLYSIYSRKKLTESKDIFFYNIGFFSYCIKIISLSSPLLSRFAGYFEVLIIFPLFYLLIYLFKGEKQNIHREERFFILYFFFTVSILLFCVKIFFFPSAEYKYRSIFSLYF
ncbi:hypothetical protein Holit_01516 [Hollandina sp. SP2]